MELRVTAVKGVFWLLHLQKYSTNVSSNVIEKTSFIRSFPVGWRCRLHQLLLCRREQLPNESPGYDTKQSDGEVPVMLVLWGNAEYTLPSLPYSLWPGVVAPDRVLSLGKLELNWVIILNCIAWNETVLTYKQYTHAKLNCLKESCFWH